MSISGTPLSFKQQLITSRKAHESASTSCYSTVNITTQHYTCQKKPSPCYKPRLLYTRMRIGYKPHTSIYTRKNTRDKLLPLPLATKRVKLRLNEETFDGGSSKEDLYNFIGKVKKTSEKGTETAWSVRDGLEYKLNKSVTKRVKQIILQKLKPEIISCLY
eukprot:TRINITY_DN12522_c0_g1_i3.p1 TRINITY_DN12522_c0_g1~~TRINITY_DN12522_c0_g1_i3.p1  ORF type:complete len:161 (+),score=16.67 TRINITY_DN12522_c0_g1_i3:327-809(+)